ncbi:MAG: M50 family metallopeptidase, partial [Bacteroidota bacterium]|nr:M50 family metallopeptidase [Bacteroidota bacterium]
KGNFSIFFVLFIVLFLIASPRLLPSNAQLIVTSVLGSLSLLYAVIDMQQDLFQEGYHQTDAEIMSSSTGLPALFWSILWLVIAFGLLYFLLKKKFKIKW